VNFGNDKIQLTPKITIMKTLVYLFAIAMLLFAGCAKDEMFDHGSNNLELKKANVPIPDKGEVCMIPDTTVLLPVTLGPNGPLLPKIIMYKYALLTGHSTHYGKFGEQTSMSGNWAYLDKEALSHGKKIIVSEYEVFTYAANGDYTIGISESRIDVTDPNNKIITGTIETISGNGRFENVVGSGEINGILPCWTIEGTIEYVK
jgi:hypothetical protein